jgi:putative transcriptional regulator
MKKTGNIDLNPDELIQALSDVRDYARGRRKISMRTTTVILPKRVSNIQPDEVKAIRVKMNVSQAVFARLLNVPVVTEASWEVGRRHPSGAALRLLQIAQREPDVLFSAAEA